MLLDGLDIHEDLHERKMGELQGGQKVRVLLAQALFGKPEALLLDEPTNYLDLDSIHWLQDFLANYDGTLIAISHDRHFLNSVTTHTADIDYQTSNARQLMLAIVAARPAGQFTAVADPGGRRIARQFGKLQRGGKTLLHRLRLVLGDRFEARPAA